MSVTEPTPEGPTPWHDLDRYVALPRVSGLRLSPDGSRLVTSVSALDPTGSRYVSALWEIDPAGARPARRLTRSAKGERGAAFGPAGDLLYVSARPDPQARSTDPEAERPALWLLPAGGGEPRVVATWPGGVTGVSVARDEGTVVLHCPTLPGAVTAADDEAARTARKDAGVSAILHTGYPIRYWDHDLGPDEPRLLAGRLPAEPEAGAPSTERGRPEWIDLTPRPDGALFEALVDVSPDGRQVVTTWQVAEPGGSRRSTVVVLDAGTGARRPLLDEPEVEYTAPVFSPDGLRVAAIAETRTTPSIPPTQQLVVVDLALGDVRVIAPDWDRWPSGPSWSPDGRSVFVTADDGGRAPVFRIELATDEVATDEVTRLTLDDGAYGDLQVSRDGRWLYAIRSAVDAAPAPVRLDARVPGEPVPLPGPGPDLDLPGTLTEVSAVAEDGVPVRGWLCLPAGAGRERPAPLLLWVHGGPLSSWNSWSWRWNPWLMVAQGYAVLLPDPALSTGYGNAFVRRGWNGWGGAPYTDLLAVTDAAEARPDIDGTRTAVMGGSFGGYVANWIAGHTDRFAGIVSHAGLWALDQFGATTDAAWYWARELTPEMMAAHSPHRFVDEIRTPMLVIHGDKDYRVPIGEGVRLWTELMARATGPDPAHRFLYFPDENHWVLKPGNVKVWYATVLAFLAATVHGRPFQVPGILGAS